MTCVLRDNVETRHRNWKHSARITSSPVIHVIPTRHITIPLAPLYQQVFILRKNEADDFILLCWLLKSWKYVFSILNRLGLVIITIFVLVIIIRWNFFPLRWDLLWRTSKQRDFSVWLRHGGAGDWLCHCFQWTPVFLYEHIKMEVYTFLQKTGTYILRKTFAVQCLLGWNTQNLVCAICAKQHWAMLIVICFNFVLHKVCSGVWECVQCARVCSVQCVRGERGNW